MDKYMHKHQTDGLSSFVVLFLGSHASTSIIYKKQSKIERLKNSHIIRYIWWWKDEKMKWVEKTDFFSAENTKKPIDFPLDCNRNVPWRVWRIFSSRFNSFARKISLLPQSAAGVDVEERRGIRCRKRRKRAWQRGAAGRVWVRQRRSRRPASNEAGSHFDHAVRGRLKTVVRPAQNQRDTINDSIAFFVRSDSSRRNNFLLSLEWLLVYLFFKNLWWG